MHAFAVILIGCGLPMPGDDPPGDDAVNDRAEGDDAPDDASELDAAAQRAPVIDSVQTASGFTQLRQNARVALVIRGRRLGATTSVSVGELPVTIDRVAASRVNVTVQTDSTTRLGPLDVIVTTPRGSAVAPDALELTPFVVSPVAGPGDGTYQSPISLCDPALDLTGEGSVVQLLAGTHRCGRRITLVEGTIFAGDPSGATVITGTSEGNFSLAFSTFWSAPSAIRDVTFAPPLEAVAISSGGGSLVIERVINAGGVSQETSSLITFDRYTHEGEGTSLILNNAVIRDSAIRHCGAGDGVRLVRSQQSGFGALTLDRVTIEDCENGVSEEAQPQRFLLQLTIRDSQFIDNRVGIFAVNGTTLISDTVIRDDPATPAVPRHGMVLGDGNIGVTNCQISGHTVSGIELGQGFSNGTSARMSGSGLVIFGGPIGLSFWGIDNHLDLRNSRFLRQTVASVDLASVDSFIDFGTPGSPGFNAFSVVSGFAVDVHRHTNQFIYHDIGMYWTTLNDARFTGQYIEGPAELAPYYRITDSDDALAF